ncbi:hypothetical protein OSB04_012058 [Centaurea solstitialis]|uniref:Pentatricopeptide repeat-containing protein n=1 Tax=Centaurea solstitialis TaxID=347529 RepID=A0AA38TAN6_9ASTR|nr:hypothetical protein OSB04_012058 [Centaurea solstitialis]
MLIDHISSGSLDDSLLKLIGKLVPKEGKEAAFLDEDNEGCFFFPHNSTSCSKQLRKRSSLVFLLMCTLLPLSSSVTVKCLARFVMVAYCFRRGVVPDVYTFSTLLNGLILEERILEAKRLFKKLTKRNFVYLM